MWTTAGPEFAQLIVQLEKSTSFETLLGNPGSYSKNERKPPEQFDLLKVLGIELRLHTS